MVTVEEVRKRAEADAKTYGYYLQPDPQLLQALFEGIAENWNRYGYPSCPCRLASGIFEYDRDIFCPCDYRDPDVAEYGGCYCIYYVSKEVYEGKVKLEAVPERRPIEKQQRAYGTTPAQPEAKPPVKPAEAKPETEHEAKGTKEEAKEVPKVEKKLWYCKQCGYVVYREDPPYICPICKAKREMFAQLEVKSEITEKD